MSKKELVAESNKFEEALSAAMKIRGVRINRESFLRKELSKFCEDDVVEKAIATTPAQAGLSAKNLELIVKSCINYETMKVSAISAAFGAPGGLAIIGTVPADIAQFYAHVVRILQKLAFLYGWQQFFDDSEENNELDDGTAHMLTIFIGVMFGVSAANAALARIAYLAAQNIPKKLMRQALTKGTIFPVVKKIAQAIGVKMTKEIFAKSIGKIIPIVGAVASGSITYAMFKPMSINLKKHLASLPTASVDFHKNQHDENIIEVDFGLE